MPCLISMLNSQLLSVTMTECWRSDYQTRTISIILADITYLLKGLPRPCTHLSLRIFQVRQAQLKASTPGLLNKNRTADLSLLMHMALNHHNNNMHNTIHVHLLQVPGTLTLNSARITTINILYNNSPRSHKGHQAGRPKNHQPHHTFHSPSLTPLKLPHNTRSLLNKPHLP